MPPNQIDVLSNPELFSKYFLKILDKDKMLVPFFWNDAQRDFHKNRTGRDLILKARQLGFSTYIQAELFRRAVTSTQTTMTMAHDSETTQKLRRMADRYWENCRFGSIQPARKYSNASLATYPEFDSTSIIATAGSKQAGRGDTYTYFHGSEVAFWPDAEKIVAGAMQGGNPDVVLESTPNGAQGYFYELCQDALAGDSIWTLHFYPWWWDRKYRIPLDEEETIEQDEKEQQLINDHGLDLEQIKWRRLKVKELKGSFIQEYPEDPYSCFLTSGNSYFGDITGVFVSQQKDYQDGHRYGIGVDWGKDNDYTVVKVYNGTIKQEVYSLRVNKMSWKEIRKRVKGVCDKYHKRHLVAEKNSIGDVNIEALRDMGLSVHAFDMTNASKADIMSELYDGIHTHDWKLLKDTVTEHEFRNFVSTQLPSGVWRLAAAADGHDDTVIASALAFEALNRPDAKDLVGWA